MENEVLVAYAIRGKSAEDRRRFYNPSCAYPRNFKPCARIDMPLGTVAELMQEEHHAIEKVRRMLQRKGVSGTVQVRVARGGVGGGSAKHTIRRGIRSGSISTAGKGFQVVIKELEV